MSINTSELEPSGLKELIPDSLKKFEPAQSDISGLREAAVLLPLVKKTSGWHILFTKRTTRVDTHKGQISFPGGAKDSTDMNMAATALRETREEIGIAEKDIDLFASLPPTPTISLYLVYPFAGIVPHPYNYILSNYEVDRIISLPLDSLIEEAKKQYDIKDNWNVKFNQKNSNDIIWGATARILYVFLEKVFL